MAELAEGSQAPRFALKSTEGRILALEDFLGKSAVVLYFYPKDDTPGCTKEACAFRDLHETFQEAGAEILGVSTDSVASHEKFRQKYGLPFPLLADPDVQTCLAYGVYKEKNMYGRKYMGIERTTFLIDQDGVIRKIYPKVKVDQHAEAVLEDVRSLTKP